MGSIWEYMVNIWEYTENNSFHGKKHGNLKGIHPQNVTENTVNSQGQGEAGGRGWNWGHILAMTSDHLTIC